MTAKPTACLALADGTIFYGRGFGAEGEVVAELVFNTAMTGYQEIMTDPSYASQIVTFTFPHIGNTGVTPEDDESPDPVAAGIVVKWDPTEPSNWRSTANLGEWMARRGRIGIGGVDTRRLTRIIRQQGAPHVVLAHDPEGNFDIEAMIAKARSWSGIVGLDLAAEVSTRQSYRWEEGLWEWPGQFGTSPEPAPFRVVALDYGAKRNILRSLVASGADVTVLPANATAEEVLAHEPEGVFLSNGPGDPEATGAYAVPMIRDLLDRDLPIFGICLGHQMMALALGAKTVKMGHGHHGANHPVRAVDSGKVEITSMNHGFAVDAQTLPEGVRETHVSLFDGSNCGLEVEGRPVFSVQYHPEASPGPHDSSYLFGRFIEAMRARR
ncbi:MAG: glutamine-hydrolyzing carbamoyl-phosphate synthase small subunit [Paracoccus sp. (in: a-proteobacteria)]|nr:glutamine-hydrolyzing carbamoyl-phosphate synthase small subunit [Paracoccus sp. (in: a-proteobacteria)]